MEYYVKSATKSSPGFTDTLECEKWGIENMRVGECATVICFPFKNSVEAYVYGIFENNGYGKFATWFRIEKGE